MLEAIKKTFVSYRDILLGIKSKDSPKQSKQVPKVQKDVKEYDVKPKKAVKDGKFSTQSDVKSKKISKGQIIGAYQTVEKVREAVQKKDVVIVLGRSGSGKTTMILSMMGFPLKKDGDDYHCSDVKDEIFRIGHGADSETSAIQMGKDPKGVIWIDTPGFHETKGHEMEMKQNLLTAEAMKSCKSFHAVMVINGPETLGRKATEMIKTLKTLLRIFDDVETARKVAIVFTQMKWKKILSKLKGYRNSNSFKSTENSKIYKLLVGIITKAERNSNSCYPLMFEPNKENPKNALRSWISDKDKEIRGETRVTVCTEEMLQKMHSRATENFYTFKKALLDLEFSQAKSAMKAIDKDSKDLPELKVVQDEAVQEFRSFVIKKCEETRESLQKEDVKQALLTFRIVRKLHQNFDKTLFDKVRGKSAKVTSEIVKFLEERESSLFKRVITIGKIFCPDVPAKETRKQLKDVLKKREFYSNLQIGEWKEIQPRIDKVIGQIDGVLRVWKEEVTGYVEKLMRMDEKDQKNAFEVARKHLWLI